MWLANHFLLFTVIFCRYVLAQQCSSNGTLAAGGSQLNQTTTVNFCLDKNNNVYVADSFYDRVLVWYQRAATGTVIASNTGNSLVVIADVFILQSSGETYILDWGFIGYRVQIWNIKTNNGTWVTGGNGTQYEGDTPRKLFVDNKRNIYILLASDTILKWNVGARQGTVVAGGHGRGSTSNQLSNALDFYVDNQETIYIVDFDNDRIQKWSKGSSSGTTIISGKVLLWNSSNDLTQIWHPFSVVGDENGNLYISDQFKRVVKWPANAKTGTLFIGGNVLKHSVDPGQIRLAADGTLYVYSFYDYSTRQPNQRIERFNCLGGCEDCINRIQFQTTRYDSVLFGPIYPGVLSVDKSPLWDDLIASKEATSDDKLIIGAVSLNEGKNFDVLQAYDSETLTVGVIQKTINSTGYGEFPKQVWEFKQQNAILYTQLFENCGWNVTKRGSGVASDSNIRMLFRGISGTALKLYIRQQFTSATFQSHTKQTSDALGPIVCAVSNTEFQKKQIKDVITRLHNKVLTKKPNGYYYTLGDYLQTNFGRATVLDEHVNRPSHVSHDFGVALNTFYLTKPTISKNPADWRTNHTVYEAQILAIYGPNRVMKDPIPRFNRLKTYFGIQP